MFRIFKKLFAKKQLQTAENIRKASGTQQLPAQPQVKEPEYTAALKLCVMGDGSRVNYEPGGLYSAKCLWWVSEETDSEGQPVYIRESKEKTVKLPAALPFSAAGKLYLNIGQLYSGEEADGLTTDIHGRQVFYYRERFPCFDSYDYLHEHRYYRWFLLKENGRLTRVYTADESGWLHVTEDVENLERKLTEELKKVGWVE